MSQMNVLLISHHVKEVKKEIITALAEQVVPELKRSIDAAAQKIADEYEPGSPFAADAAAELLLWNLVGFLMLSEIDSPEECVRLHQMQAQYVKYWLGIPTGQ